MGAVREDMTKCRSVSLHSFYKIVPLQYLPQQGGRLETVESTCGSGDLFGAAPRIPGTQVVKATSIFGHCLTTAIQCSF